jgi:predicted aspartyl protease
MVVGLGRSGRARGLAVSLVAVAAASASCGPAAGKPEEPSGGARLAAATSAGGPHPKPTRRAALKFEVRGRTFPMPLVTGTIAKTPVTMLVDTGANSHVIAGWLARKLGLRMREVGDVGADHVGKAIATFRVENAEMTVDGWGPLAGGEVLATEVPKVIEELGIGAFLSPQRLVEEGDAVVLDLPAGELRAAWFDEARTELAASGASGAPLVAGDGGRACEDDGGPIKGLSFVVPATIDSHRAELLLDTGAPRSDLFMSSRAGAKLLARSTANDDAMVTVSGAISARRLRGARVSAGAFSAVSDVELVPGAADASCPRDGVLAMDVLRSCTLVLGRSRVYGRCSAPSTAPAGSSARPLR